MLAVPRVRWSCRHGIGSWIFAFVALSQAVACSDGEAHSPRLRPSAEVDEAEGRPDEVVTLVPSPDDEASADAPAAPSGERDRRLPDPACLLTTAPRDAVRRVELANKVSTASHVTTSLIVHGDNALSNVRLDVCTEEGLLSDVGGGMRFLGGGGDVTRRWQTKTDVVLPRGKVQFHVVADGEPELKLVYDVELE